MPPGYRPIKPNASKVPAYSTKRKPGWQDAFGATQRRASALHDRVGPVEEDGSFRVKDGRVFDAEDQVLREPVKRTPHKRYRPVHDSKPSDYGGGGFGDGSPPKPSKPRPSSATVVTGRNSKVRRVKNPTHVDSISSFLHSAGQFAHDIAELPITPSAIGNYGQVRRGGPTARDGAYWGLLAASMGMGGEPAAFGPASVRMSPQIAQLMKFLRFSPYGHMIQGQLGQIPGDVHQGRRH